MLRYPGMRSYLLDLLAHVFFKVTESMEGSGCHGRRSCLLLKFRAQILVLKRQHAAVGVIDDDEFLRAEKLVRNDERAQGVLGDDPSGIANDVGIPSFQAQNLRDDEPGIHACDNHQLASWREGKVSKIKAARVRFVSLKDFVRNAHIDLLSNSALFLRSDIFAPSRHVRQTQKSIKAHPRGA